MGIEGLTSCKPSCEFPARAHVLECNNKTDKTVHLKAGISNPTNAPKGWTLEGGKYTKTFAASNLTKKFTTDNNGKKWLELTTTQSTSGCKMIKVDNVEVCEDNGESYTFKCKYDLSDQVISDKFAVTGQDTEATAEGTGTLEYTLTVDDDAVTIGDKINFAIAPKTPGLVFATASECNVKYQNNAITIFGHRTPKCTTASIGAAWDGNNPTASSKSEIDGSWTAFKWSTSTGKTDKEDQSFECTIKLSENEDKTSV